MCHHRRHILIKWGHASQIRSDSWALYLPVRLSARLDLDCAVTGQRNPYRAEHDRMVAVPRRPEPGGCAVPRSDGRVEDAATSREDGVDPPERSPGHERPRVSPPGAADGHEDLF